jgi:hypothetical protein
MTTRKLPDYLAAALALLFTTSALLGAVTQPRYYAHEARHDQHGVIAPWYQGLNGQCDLRVRIAAETLKRYPWTTTNTAVAAWPDYLFTSLWQISSNGVITPKAPSDWMNGDLGQRATSTLNGFVDYYRYSGDPASIAQVTYMADFLVDHCVTPPDHPWPGIFISVPVKGKAYGKCDPAGMIQLDLVASTGQGLLRAYQLAGNARWLQAATHWGDLLAAHCNLNPGADPWPRYANPETAKWKDNKQTGGVTMILAFLDDLIRLGYTGSDNRIVAARDAGRAHLRDKLLPAWAAQDTWGRYFWDWVNDVQNCLTTPDAARYVLDHPDEFANWRCDTRNVLSLFLNHSSVSAESRGDVYSGAWAFPEASRCCQRSLWYAPFCLAPAVAQYAVQAQDPWARELAYRMMVLQTYDVHENGVTEDNIDGGIIVNGNWLNIAHPLPLRWILATMAWLPEELGANRENHLMRSSAVVNSVVYGKGHITYSTYDAPSNTVEVLRLAFVPNNVLANGRKLDRRRDLGANGYLVKKLPNGDAVVSIRHDGSTKLDVTGNDPQQLIAAKAMPLELAGHTQGEPNPIADLSASFTGNQVRLIGAVGPDGGLARLRLDGEKQLVHLDCWNPAVRERQVLYYRNGLTQGRHTLEIAARRAGNPYSTGTAVRIQGVQYSAATGSANFPSGTGPRDTQRMVFGYTGRQDLRDSQGHTWRPATELVTRIGEGRDSVAECWWTAPAKQPIQRTPDPDLYRYGVHGRDFWVNLTVGPGRYYARLKFAATRGLDTRTNCFSIRINGRRVVERLDVAATAGGTDRAVDLVFNDISPANGVIEIRLTAAASGDATGPASGEAFVQALELGRGSGGKGATPISASATPQAASSLSQPAPAARAKPFDYFQNSWSVIGLKDYNEGTRITPENELLLANKTRLRISCGPSPTPLSRRQTKTVLDGWLPVVLLSTEADGVRYDFTLWATPLPTVKDWRAAFDWPTEGDNYLNWVSVKATNLARQRAIARLQLDFIMTNAPKPTEWTASLAPGQSAEMCFRIPFKPVADAAAFDSESPKLWLDRTVSHWRSVMAKAARIQVPCEKSTQALLAAHVCQLLASDHGVLHGGEGFYDEFYIRDGAYQVLELEEAGLLDAARKTIAAYLRAQRPDGRFETQKNQFDANGQAVWTLWQFYKLTADRAFLRQAYPQMRRAAEWTLQARRQVPPDSAFPGVLPNAVADGEYLWDGKHHIVGYDLWNLRGLLCVADAARALGDQADAQYYQQQAGDYRGAIDAACKKTGLAFFPPSWEKVGTHWGNTETLWPTELFAPDDRRVSALLKEVRQHHGGGFCEGTIRWTGSKEPAIHPYLSSYTTMASLIRGEHDAFVEEYYWYLLHSTATHAFPEGIFYGRRFAWSDTIPHATGAANFAFLLRHALLHERGKELHLLLGAPDWWLEKAREIRVENAPTHFGPMSLHVRGTAKGVELKLDATRRQTPEKIILHLPTPRPAHKVPRGVTVVYHPDEVRRWDYPTILEAYRSLPAAPLIPAK